MLLNVLNFKQIYSKFKIKYRIVYKFNPNIITQIYKQYIDIFLYFIQYSFIFQQYNKIKNQKKIKWSQSILFSSIFAIGTYFLFLSFFSSVTLLVYLVIKINTNSVIIHSNHNTKIISPYHTTALVNNNDQTNLGISIPSAPNAKYVWMGVVVAGYPQNITIQQTFQIQCVNQALTLYITADLQYNFTVNGYSGSGNNILVLDTYTIPNSITCNQIVTLTIDAYKTGASAGFPGYLTVQGGVKFAVIGSSCPACTTGFIFNPSLCQCSSCNSLLSGCLDCSSITICTTCTVSYFLNGNSCNQCNQNCVECSGSANNCLSCSLGMYLNPSNQCVFCQTGCLICTATYSTSICVNCSIGYYLNISSNSCITCSIGCINCSNSNCITCNSASNFILSSSNNCICQSGYILNGLSCKTCNSTLNGCIQCLSSTVCKICDNTNNYILDPVLQAVCICDYGYSYFDSKCNLCNTFMPGCLSCFNLSICNSCDSNNKFRLIGNSCQCIQGFYLNSLKQCAQCAFNCLNCSNISTNCISCSAGMFLNSSNNCQGCISNCQTCYSSITCTSCTNFCNSLAFLNVSNCSCMACSAYKSYCISCIANPMPTCTTCMSNYYVSFGNCYQCDPNCLTCLGSSTLCTSCSNGNYLFNFACFSCQIGCLNCGSLISCTNCNTSLHYILNAGICICSTGYAQNNSICQTCAKSLPGCLVCNSISICTSCDISKHFILQGNICQCVLTFTKMNNICYPCNISIPRCSICTNVSVCTSCIAGFHLLNSFNCSETCGDGIIFNLACDDGNLLNGDGCSSICTIETNYTCINGSMISKSVCSYNKPLSINLVNTMKNPESNTIYYTFLVFPILNVLSSINFNSTLSFTPNVGNFKAYYANGSISITLIYNRSMQYSKTNLTFIPSINNATFAIPPTISTFITFPLNNFETTLLTQNQYEISKQIHKMGMILLILILFTLFVSIYFSRLIGIQILSVYQIFLVSLGTLKFIPNQLYPILEFTSYIYGYNKQTFNYMQHQLILSSRLQGINFSGYIIQNSNVMLWLQIVILGIYFLIKLLELKYFAQIFKYRYICHELTLGFVLYNTINFSYSFGVQVVQQNNHYPSHFAENIIIGSISIIIIICTVYHLSSYGRFVEQRRFKQLNHHWEITKQRFHISIYLLHRLCLGFYMGISDYLQKMQYVLLAIQIIYIVYLLYFNVYRNRLYNMRAILQEITILINFILMMYVNNDFADDEIFKVIIIYFSLFFVSTIIVIISLALNIKKFIKIRKRIQGKFMVEIFEEANRIEELSAEIKKQENSINKLNQF